MTSRRSVSVASLVAALLFVAGISLTRGSTSATAQEPPSDKPAYSPENAITPGMGRLYIFRPIRSFGAHVESDVTVNGVKVHRLTSGNGFYCDVAPGDYVISMAGHKTRPLTVPVAAGQPRYICVMLEQLGGVSPRGGALTSDASFDVRLFEPDFGEQRAREYHLTHANCQR